MERDTHTMEQFVPGQLVWLSFVNSLTEAGLPLTSVIMASWFIFTFTLAEGSRYAWWINSYSHR